MSTGNKTVIRDPVIAWHSELDPAVPPRPEPPPVPFTVTRSEVVITPSRVTVHIWCAASRAVPA